MGLPEDSLALIQAIRRRRLKLPEPRKPTDTRLQLNTQHPFAQNMVCCIPFLEGLGDPVDLVRGVPIIPSGTIRWGSVDGQLAQKTLTNTSYWTVGTNTPTGMNGFPTESATVLLIRAKSDLTLRTHFTFGIGNSTGDDGGGPERMSAHVPWSDGNVYWDFGGYNSPNRLTWLTAGGTGYKVSTGIEYWAFVAGTQGSAIYYNGVQRASQSTPLKRWDLDLTTLLINNAEIGGNLGDLSSFLFFAVLNTEWPQGWVAHWAKNPWEMLVPVASKPIYPSRLVNPGPIPRGGTSQYRKAPGAQVDWEHPLSNQLRFFLPLVEMDLRSGTTIRPGLIFRDIVGNTKFSALTTSANLVVSDPSRTGLGITFPRSPAAHQPLGTAGLGSTGATIPDLGLTRGPYKLFTAAVKFRSTAERNAGIGTHILFCRGITNPAWQFRLQSSSGITSDQGVRCEFVIGGAASVATKYDFNLGEWFTAFGTWDGTNQAVHIYDEFGALRIRVATANATPPVDTSTTLAVGGNNNSTLDGDIEWAGIWNRILSSSDMSQMAAEPYELLQQPTRRIRRIIETLPVAPIIRPSGITSEESFGTAEIVGSHEITPPSGTLSFTGVSPEVQGPVSLTPPAAALTLSGVAPGIFVDLAITPPAGSLVFTGIAPTVTGGGVVNSNITPPTGSLAVAGVVPTVLQGRVIAPSAGALLLTGTTSIVIINISPVGIPSAEAFGTAQVGDITVPSIASLEAFGTALLVAGDIAPLGIPSEEVVSDFEIIDTPGAAGTITLTTGIATGEAFGTATLTNVATIYPEGIPSGFDMDLHTVGVAVGTTGGFGIASEEAFGLATVYELKNALPPVGSITTKRLCSPLKLLRAEIYATAPDPAFILPDVYGDFSIGGLRGPVPAVLVTQESPWTYIAAAHAVQEITNVYVDDVEALSGFSTIPAVELGGGPQVAAISFTEQPTGQVSWRGKGRMNDGSALITNPIEQLVQLLTDRAEYHTEDFDATAFAEAVSSADARGWATAWVFADDRQIQDWITEVLFNIMGFWRISGAAKLQVTLDPGGAFTQSNLIESIIAARDCLDGDDGIEFVADRTNLVNKLVAYYLYSWSTGQPSDRVVTLEDTVSINAYEEIRKSVTLRGIRDADLLSTWSDILFERQAFVERVEGATLAFTVKGSKMAHATIGDLIAFTWPYGPMRELGHPFVNEVLRILSISQDFARGGAATITAVDTGEFVSDGTGGRLLTPLAL